MKTLVRATLFVALIAPLSVSSAQGARWKGWIGCWSVVPGSEQSEPLPGQRLVCVAPTPSADVAVITAIADGAVLSRDTIDASGRALSVKAVGCNGMRSATWSADQRRVYLKSDVVCDGLRTNVSAILAMTAKGEWLDVRRIAAGGGSDLRVARYRDVGIPPEVPTDIREALLAPGARDASARTVASASGTSAVIDASRAVDAEVVEAWIYESGENFAADDKSIRELANAGVKGDVSDAVIAMSAEPKSSRPWMEDYIRGPYGRGSSDFWDQGTGMRLVGSETPMYDPWGFGYGPFGDRVYNSAVADGFTVASLAPGGREYGRGVGYGPNGIGWGFGYGYYRKAPTGKSLIAYYAPMVPVLHQNPSGSTASTSLSAPAYPDAGQKAGSASTPKDKPSVMESVAKSIVDAATSGSQKKSAPSAKPR